MFENINGTIHRGKATWVTLKMGLLFFGTEGGEIMKIKPLFTQQSPDLHTHR